MRAAIAERFSGDAAPELFRFFRIFSRIRFGEACACLGARERSERVTARHRPRRQRSRRLVSKTSTRLALKGVKKVI